MKFLFLCFCQVPYDVSKEKLKNPLETREISQRKCFTHWQFRIKPQVPWLLFYLLIYSFCSKSQMFNVILFIFLILKFFFPFFSFFISFLFFISFFFYFLFFLFFCLTVKESKQVKKRPAGWVELRSSGHSGTKCAILLAA